MTAPDRLHEMNKPEGFVPAVQRYSARFDPGVDEIEVLLLGVQSLDPDDPAIGEFTGAVVALFAATDGPVHHDHARYVDEQAYTNQVTVAYWADRAAYRRWWSSNAVTLWWNDPAKLDGTAGYFVEPLPATVGALETITFRQYVRGLAACPMSTVEPMGESGYWGAARDRIPRSATDRFDPSPDDKATPHPQPPDERRRLMTPPVNYCLIRSGVSWADCGDEQLDSYLQNVKPRLDEGMEYLRSNPIDSGCWSLRQLDVVAASGSAEAESYVAGYFTSLAHLERWAHKHPTHLAIYGQAQKERVKYADDLELRTYHEVYVIEAPETFEYLNCHPSTGALGLT